MNNQNNNQYYVWWKRNKPALSLLPAIIFWAVSVIFFMVGLNFKNPIIVGGIEVSKYIAIALSISNTIIQIIGNEQEQEGLGMALWIGWIGSYALGIGTNVVGLLSILAINNVILEWVIAVGLGTMIEVLPEKLVVQFLKTVQPSKGKSKYPPQQSRPPYQPTLHNVSNSDRVRNKDNYKSDSAPTKVPQILDDKVLEQLLASRQSSR